MGAAESIAVQGRDQAKGTPDGAWSDDSAGIALAMRSPRVDNWHYGVFTRAVRDGEARRAERV